MTSEEKKKKEEQALSPEIEKLTKEKEEYLNGWKRAKADLINYKKDELKRLEEVARFGSESLILELISILDDFDLALATLEKQEAAEKGIYLIRSRFEDILKRRGLERIKVEVGEKFNPAVHEAILTVDGNTQNADMVAEEIEAGYTLHGKVIRPARVKVWALPKNS